MAPALLLAAYAALAQAAGAGHGPAPGSAVPAPATAPLLATAQAAPLSRGTAPAAPLSRGTATAATPSHMTAPTADIRDIRGPKPVGSPWLIPAIALTGMLAVGGAYASWVWNKRRGAAARRAPLDIALARLDVARALMLPDRGREFSIEVSSIVREYIESRFRIMAAHLTTHEFLRDLLEPGNSSLAEYRALLGDFLQTCDLAKFGGWNLSAEEMETMVASARRFVRESAAAAATWEAAARSAAKSGNAKATAPTVPNAATSGSIALPAHNAASLGSGGPAVPASQSSTQRHSYVSISST